MGRIEINNDGYFSVLRTSMSSLQEESVRNNMPVTVLGTSIDFQLLQERLAEPEREVQRLKEPLAK